MATVEITTTITTQTEVADLTGTNAAALLAEFEETKAAIKALEEKKDAAEALLRELLGDAEVATINGEKLFKLVHGMNTSFDRELMKKAFPEAFSATLKKKAYTYIKAM
jgi:DNA replication protein DnaD